jgi:hypothetical protein
VGVDRHREEAWRPRPEARASACGRGCRRRPCPAGRRVTRIPGGHARNRPSRHLNVPAGRLPVMGHQLGHDDLIAAGLGAAVLAVRRFLRNLRDGSGDTPVIRQRPKTVEARISVRSNSSGEQQAVSPPFLMTRGPYGPGNGRTHAGRRNRVDQHRAPGSAGPLPLATTDPSPRVDQSPSLRVSCTRHFRYILNFC